MVYRVAILVGFITRLYLSYSTTSHGALKSGKVLKGRFDKGSVTSFMKPLILIASLKLIIALIFLIIIKKFKVASIIIMVALMGKV